MNPYLDPSNNPYLRPAATNPYYDPNPVNPYLQTTPSEPVPAITYQDPEPQYNEVEKALTRGFENLDPSIDRAIAAGQGVLGFEEAAKANLAEAQAAEAQAARPSLRARVPRFRDAQTAKDYLDWGTSAFFENLPLMGTMALGGVAGALGGIARTGVANKALATIGGMAPYWAQTVSENSQNIMDDPNAQGTFQEKSLGVVGGGTAQAALGGIPIAGVLGKILKPGMSLGKRVGSAMATGVVGEGFTEMGEAGIGKATHKLFNPEVQLNSKEAWLDYVDALAGGAVVGGAFGSGGALVSHPFLAKAAQRDPDGPLGFAQKHRRLFGDQDLETLGSLSPEEPRSKLQAKMWEIEDRQNLDVAYQDLLGMSRKDYEAKRLDAERMLDDFAFGLYTNSLDANNPQTKQLAQAYQSDKDLRGIVDQYIKENKQDWDAMPDWRVGPEGRVPLKSEFEQPLVRERGGQQDNAEQEGFGSDLAFGDRQGVNKGKDDLTSSSGDFLTPAGGLPWKSAEASKRDNPNFDPATIDETTNQFTEREMVRFLPVEGQQSYEAARKAGALPEWRRARQQEGDEWGAILNNQELRPVSLRTMLEEEYDTQDPERIAEIVQRDYLSNQNAIKGKDAAAKRAQYEADPLAYADDYMVVRKTRLPNLISGRDEFTPTERELIPEVRPRDAQAMQSKRAQAQALRSTYDEVLWDGFSDQEKGFLQEFGKLEDKFVDVGRKMPVEEKAKYRSLYQENKDLVDFYRTRRADLHELTKEAKALEKEAQNIDYQTKPVIDDFDPDKEAYVKGDKTNFQQTAAKRIPILVRDQRSGEWLKRSIDPMQLILQEQSQKGNFSKSPDTFIDEMANALHSGLAGILANPSMEVRFPTGRDPQTKKYTFAPDDPKAPKYIDPETIVYSRRNGGVQFRWKDLDAAPGFDRLKSALGSIREQKLKARDAEQRQSFGFAETDTIAKLRNYPEGADLIAQQSLAELPQRLEKEKMLRLGQRGLTAEQKQQIEAEYEQKLRDETGRIELQRLKDRARIEDRQEREEDETRFDSREMTAEVGTGHEWETGQAKTTPGNHKWSDDMPKEDQVYTFDKDSKRVPAEEVTAPLPGQWEGMRARAARRAQGLPETAFGAVDEPPEATRTTYPQTETQTFGERDQTGQETKPFTEPPLTDFASLPIEGYADPRTLPPAEARLYAADSIRQQENPAAAAQGKREAMQRITRKFGDKPWIVRRELAKAEARYYYDMEVITERQEQARQAGQREPQPIEFDAEGNRKPRPVSEAPPTTPRIYAITLPSGRTRVATPEEADAINRTIQLQRGPNTAEEAPAAPTRNRLKDLQKIRQDEKKVGRAYIGPSGSKLAYYEFSPDTQSWETHEIPLVRGALDATTGSNTLKRQTEMDVTAAPDAPSSGAVTAPFGTEVPPGITATQPELRQGPTPGGVVSTAPPAYREAPKADTGPLRLGIRPQYGPPVPDPTSPTGLREGPRIHFDTGKLIFDPPPREEKPQGAGVTATGAYREGQAPQPPTPPQYEPLVINEDKVADYYGRTKINADKAEVTLAMAMDYGTAGEGLTKRLAGEKLVKWQPRSALTPFADAVVAQLKQSKGKTLNIAGNALDNWAKFTDKNKKPITQEHVNWAVYKVLKHIKENYPQLERVVTGGQTGTDIAGAIAARALGIPVEVNMPKGFRQEGQFSQTKDKVLRQIEDGAAKINQQLGEPANGLRTQEEQQAPDPAPAAVAGKPAEPSVPQAPAKPELSATARSIRNKFVQSLKGKTPEQMRGVAAAKRQEAKTANDYKRQFLLADADIAERMANGEDVKFSATLDIPGLTTDADLVRHQAAEAKLRRADLQREERFANELLKKLGLQRTVRLATVAEAHARRPDKLGAHGMKWTDADGTVRVYLNPLLGKAARLETLGHELGHIVFKDALSQADTSTQKAIKQAFEAWRDGAKASRSLKAIYDSKKTAALLDSLWGLDGQTLDSLSAEDQAYVLDFEEWFADNVGRWMVSDAKPVGLVQQFFKDVADLLRDLFRLLHGNQPDAAVKKYLDSLFVREEPVSLFPQTVQVDGVARSTTNSEGRPIHPTLEGVKNFWKWFGDSKIVDEQGRPKVVYHGTNKAFSVFKGFTNWATANETLAKGYAENRSENRERDARLVPLYMRMLSPLNLRHIEDNFGFDENYRGDNYAESEQYTGLNKAEITVEQFLDHIISYAQQQNIAFDATKVRKLVEELKKAEKASESTGFYAIPSFWAYPQNIFSKEGVEKFKSLFVELGFDGIVHYEGAYDAQTRGMAYGDTYGVFDAEGLKSAELNSGDYSAKNPNIHLAATPGAPSFTPAERKVLGQAFRAEHVQRQLRKLLENDPVALDQLRDPDAAIAYGYQFWLQGGLNVGPRAQTAFQRLLKATKDTLGEVDEGTQAEAILRAPGANAHKAQLTDTAVQRGYAKLKGQSAKLMEVLRKVAFMGHEQIKALDNPYTDRLAELIYNEAGTEGVAEGYLSAQVRQAGRFLDQLHNLFDGHDEALGQRVMDLATKRAPLSGANAEERRLVRGVYQLFADVLNYSKRAGVEPQLRGKDVTIDGETVRDYFPRVIDTDYLMAHKTEFLAMLNQPKYKDYVGDAEGIYRAYLENFGVESEFDPLADPSAPQASSFKKREFAWIEDEDIAPYLSRDLGEALSAYIYQTVKHSEWRRRFGGKDSRTYQQLAASKKATPGQLRFAEQNGKYLDLLEDARATGLMPEQEERVTKYMEGVLGRLGTDINPTFNMLQSWMVVLQNWALLGMSAITSLADVAGLAVRGDIQVAWEGLKAGLNEVVALAKKDKTSLKTLGEMLGTIERHTAVEALGFEYGGYRIIEGARKWNDRLFRWNLLQSWTRGTRLMALASGKSFITKHVKDPGTHSQRFLDQLNLRKGDVQFDAKGDIRILTEAERKAASEAELKRDDRVRAALNQFVDEAILRPNAAERPVYFNDPHYMLFTHLKQWVYSFQSVILRRVVSEAIEGNYMPMVRLMGYVPLTMAAIALKDAIKGDDEDKDWATRVGEGVERSGVLGYGQVFYDMMNDSQYGQMTGSSLMDPTSESMLDLLDALISAGSDDDVKAFERFLPLQSVWGG